MKIKFLIKGAIPTIFRIGSPSNSITMMTLLALALIVYLQFILMYKTPRFTTSLLIIIGIFLSLAPSTLTSENWASTRSLFEGEWFIACIAVISFYSFVTQILRKNNSIYLILVYASILTVLIVHSNYLLYFEMTKPQLLEIKLASKAISGIDSSKLIFVSTADWSENKAKWVYADEYGLPSTCASFVPVPLTQLILNRDNHKVKYVYKVRFSSVMSIKYKNTIDYKKVLN